MLVLVVLFAATVVVISAPWLVLISGSIIPAVTAAVTKDLTGWLQVVILAVLAAVAGVISQSTTGSFPLGPTVMTVVVTAGIAIAAHYGYAVSGLLGQINSATRGFGIGRRAHGPSALPPMGAPPGTVWYADPDPPKVPGDRRY